MSQARVPVRDRRRARELVAIAVIVVCVLGVGFSAWYRGTYWVFPGLGASPRVHWCGRDYEALPGPTMTWRQVAAEAPWPVRVVDLYPPLGLRQEALFASVDPAIARTPARQITSCTTLLYARLGPDRYRPYSILGGP
jgi:hypothetical protein